MHAPHDGARGGDLILQEYLSPPVEGADSTLIRCSVGPYSAINGTR